MNTFQETEFEAIVTVNVTLLLVLTTLFIGISNTLPKTAYIKVTKENRIQHLFYLSQVKRLT